MKRALIAGASGLVGSFALEYLLQEESYSQVTALLRRPMVREHPKLRQRICDFEHPEALGVDLAVEDVFCCLGTTIHQAGSQEAFRHVDGELPLKLAKAAKEVGAKQFLMVTALGADKNSKIFYNRVKGELEEALQALGYPGLKVFRPSMLLGSRQKPRQLEAFSQAIMRAIGPLMNWGVLKHYRAISSKAVAWAMVEEARRNDMKFKIFENEAMCAKDA